MIEGHLIVMSCKSVTHPVDSQQAAAVGLTVGQYVNRELINTVNWN